MPSNQITRTPGGIEVQHSSFLISSELSHGLTPHLIVIFAPVRGGGVVRMTD